MTTRWYSAYLTKNWRKWSFWSCRGKNQKPCWTVRYENSDNLCNSLWRSVIVACACVLIDTLCSKRILRTRLQNSFVDKRPWRNMEPSTALMDYMEPLLFAISLFVAGLTFLITYHMSTYSNFHRMMMDPRKSSVRNYVFSNRAWPRENEPSF